MIRDVLTLARLRAMTPDEAAGLWLVRNEEPSAADAALFADWLADDEANAIAWERARVVWDVLDLGEDDAALQAMRSAALALGPEPRRRPWFVGGLVLAGVAAASVALVVGLPYVMGLERTPRSGEAAQVASLTGFGLADFSTGTGQRSVTDLPDGSRLSLDTDSAVDVAYAQGRRQVRLLRGQALFEVAHDPAHPFSVEARDVVVTALGTRFDVKLEPARTTVVLAEGRVSIARKTAVQEAAPPAVQLRPGERFVSEDGSADMVGAAKVDVALLWQQGFVQFHNETLAAAVAELNRYSRTRLVIRDPRVASLRVSGRYKTGDVESFCRTLALVQPVRAVRRGPDLIELIAARP